MLSNDSTRKLPAAALQRIFVNRKKMGKTLALDLGEAQIGLAISDDHKLLARGLDTMKGKDRRNCMIVLGEIIRQQEVDEIVVGLPKNMNGSLGTQAEKALAFVQELKRQFGLPVRAWDERLTTVAAKRTLIESGVKRSRRGRDSLDRISAILILQSYLDSLSRRTGEDPIHQR
jgi:putative holliday junction resolvase